jgi:hypothetical protein
MIEFLRHSMDTASAPQKPAQARGISRHVASAHLLAASAEHRGGALVDSPRRSGARRRRCGVRASKRALVALTFLGVTGNDGARKPWPGHRVIPRVNRRLVMSLIKGFIWVKESGHAVK